MTSPEIFGVPEKMDPHTADGKAPMLIRLQNMTAVVDSIGICHFTMFGWGWNDLQSQIDAACEGGFSVERLEEIGERIWNLERQFNLSTGMTPDQDTLPQRVLKEAAKTGPAQGKVSLLDKMLPEYYEARGWGRDGIPSQATLQRLGL
jgi:aldehyde:ferredoxin oxidoreductase